jgi:uncharacterized membrane protein YeaQ/YmgE (transglycosylase-associated protein family)
LWLLPSAANETKRDRRAEARWQTGGRNAMHIIWALIVGLFVGAIAKLLMPGRDPGGIIITIVLGIAGSVIAGFLGRALGLYRAGDVGPGIIASVIGAMILLAIYRMVVRRRTI